MNESSNQPVDASVSEPERKKLLAEQIASFLDNNQPADALRVFETLPEEEQQQVNNQFVLGVIYVKQHEYQKAIDVLEDVVKLDPMHTDASHILSHAQSQVAEQAAANEQPTDRAARVSMLRTNTKQASWDSGEHKSIISLRDVGLRYGRIRGLSNRDPDWSLRNLDLDIYEGETLGIVGSNGAGKTTLLRVLADLIKPDEGRIEASCRRRMMLSISMGFVPTISGRKNIMLYGLLLGESLFAVKRKVEGIIAFSELAEAIDDPVYTYSLGMRARLGFAIAFSAEPDLLLIDEVLGVGDQKFGQKSYDALRRRLEANKTAVLTTHNDIFIRNLCDRAVWMQHGRIKMVGLPNDVVDEYQRSMGS